MINKLNGFINELEKLAKENDAKTIALSKKKYKDPTISSALAGISGATVGGTAGALGGVALSSKLLGKKYRFMGGTLMGVLGEGVGSLASIPAAKATLRKNKEIANARKKIRSKE